jgi:GMP synthase (glutamine-hydrolysing)
MITFIKMQRFKLKILLLQIRQDQAVRLEEHSSFSRYAKLKTNQIDILNVFDTPVFDFEIANKYDAVFVGGASEASVLEPETYNFVYHSINFLNYLIDIQKPVFASCFGYQLAILALGGEIIRDTENFEMGTYQIELTKACESDQLMCGIPNNFWMISVHQEKAITIPDNCELLGYTQDSTHLFKVKNAPFWAFQFHPELDIECLTTRLKAYQDKYTDGDDHFDEVIASLQPTPISNDLVAKFVDRVLLNS